MEEHLTRELFRAIATGWRNPGDLAAIALAHLFELCTECRREFDAWRRDLGNDSRVPESADYDAVIERIRSRVAETPGGGESPIRLEVRQARARADQLLRLDPDQQAEWIRSEADRFVGTLLAEVLIEEAFRRTPRDPSGGCVLANLARLVLHHSPTSLRATAVYARALLYLANAVRVTSDLPRAEQIMGDARYLLRSQGGGDRLVRAEFDHMEGVLRVAQFRLDDAKRLLLRALMTYRAEPAPRETVEVLITLGRIHSRSNEYARSLALLDQAERIVESAPDSWIKLVILHNRASNLSRLGEPQLALQVFEQSQELYDQQENPIHELRRYWNRARIARKMGDLDLADQYLNSARTGFAMQGFRLEVAHASLEIGDLYLDQGRFKEAEALGEEAEGIFELLGVSPRVAAARRLRALATAK